MPEIPAANWSNSLRYHFHEALYPSSLEEIQQQVAATPRLKVLGMRHSFSPIADGDVAMVLSGAPLDPVVEPGGRQVSIAGHATYADLAGFLAAHKLAVHNVASLPGITIAGAIANATHGSGVHNGNLATAVAGLQIVAANGDLVTVKRGNPDFNGMAVHLGVLGVVTRVTLDVQPAFDVAQTVYEKLSWQAAFDKLDDIMSAAYSVSIFSNFGETAGNLWVKSTDVAAAIPDNMFGAVRATTKKDPIEAADPDSATEQLGVPGLWSERLFHFRIGTTPSSGDEIQSEFHIPRQHGAAAIEAVRSQRAHFVDALQVCELRAVAADELWLSPQYKRDTLSMHFTWFNRPEAVGFGVKHIEAALQTFDVRPHMGKVFSPYHAGASYPMLAGFAAIRDRMDPGRKFSNPWLEEVVFGR